MKPLNPKLGYFARRMAAKSGVTSYSTSKAGARLASDKGEKGGSCNRTACQKPAKDDRDGIHWFNHSTRKYYCFGCAWELNDDPFNKRDAQQIWGHTLCTLVAA